MMVTSAGIGAAADEDVAMIQSYSAKQAVLTSDEKAVPFVVTPGDASSCGLGEVTHGMPCEAHGWVYCQDAYCSQEPYKNADGVWVSDCECWQPENHNWSTLPEKVAGAPCVMGGIGGTEMCDQMKSGSLFSTYGPQGWKPTMVVAECKSDTWWLWCWGAPCSRINGKIVCHCPLMQTNFTEPQPACLPKNACDRMVQKNENPCDKLWNSQPGHTPFSPPICYSE